MGYEELTILRSYKTNKNDIVKEFYLPVLKKSVLYKRAVGFFSSTALIELSKGISSLVKNGGKIRFIVSPLLSVEDIEAIQQGYDERKIIADALTRELREPKNNSDKERLGWLSQLIANGILEIKVAFTPPQKKTGMYHEKIGIIYDENRNRLAFTGSMNETINAFHNNYESIVVFNSLVVEDEQRVRDLENDFDSLWAGREENIIVLEFPNVVRDKLVPFEKAAPQKDFNQFEQEDLYELAPVIAGIPLIPREVKLHEYQEDAIDTWINNNFCGIFDMATGTGKTYTGLGAAAKLFEIKKCAAIIIVAPFQHLVDQWVEDIVKFNMRPTIGYSASPQKNWKKRLENDVLDFQLGVINSFCFVTTNATFSSDYVQRLLDRLGDDTLIIVDEAHNFGSEHLSLSLNPKFEYRLALSATLERHNDPQGTQILKSYFGKKCIEYGLDRAIRENKLTPYYYHPVLVYLDEDEIENYKDLSYKISRECHANKHGELKITERGKTLLLARSRIVAGAKQKLVALREQIETYRNDTHMLVYCGATRIFDYNADSTVADDEGERQIVAVSKLLGNEFGMKVTHFTSNESAAEREVIKQRFAEADPYQAIVAIKCLDEGVNIPSIRTAFILASTTNPKEYIQRRGRVLRLAANKPYAVIYDFVTLIKLLDEVDPYASDYNCGRALAKRELSRIEEFGRIALNSRDSDQLINDIQDVYNIKPEEMEDDFDGNEFRA
jgi:superfamily II DNA or RNA helicase